MNSRRGSPGPNGGSIYDDDVPAGECVRIVRKKIIFHGDRIDELFRTLGSGYPARGDGTLDDAVLGAAVSELRILC